jgi:hypothetical protein
MQIQGFMMGSPNATVYCLRGHGHGVGLIPNSALRQRQHWAGRGTGPSSRRLHELRKSSTDQCLHLIQFFVPENLKQEFNHSPALLPTWHVWINSQGQSQR